MAGSDRALAELDAWLRVDGDLVAVHWLGPTDYPRHGADLAPWLDAVPWLRRLVHHRDEEFDLGVWRRTSSESS